MKYFISLLLILCSFGYSETSYIRDLDENRIYSEEEIEDTEIIESKVSKIDKVISNLSVLFNPAYFYQQDKNFRKIYGTGFLPKVELSYNVYNNWHIWLDVSYFSKRGKIKKLDTKTRIYLAPIALGLKYAYYLRENVNLYLKIAPNFCYLKIRKNVSNIKKSSKRANIFGASFGSGVLIELRGGWLVGAFLNYFYDKKKVSIEGKRMFDYWGGLEVGGSMGYYF